MSKPRPLVYRILINLSLTLASLLICFLLAEAIFRLLEKTETIPPYGIHVAKYGEGLGKHQAKLVRTDNERLHVVNDTKFPGINKHGMRDRHFNFAKPNNVFRIAAVGDSVTYGLGVPLEATFAKQLQAMSEPLQLAHNVQVLNFGVNSYDTVAEIELIQSKVLKFNPDLIILTYILNDTMRPQEMTEMFQNRMKEAIKKKQQEKNNPPVFHSLVWVRHLFNQAIKDRMSTLLYKRGYDGEVWQNMQGNFDALAEINQEIPTVVFVFPLIEDWKNYKFDEQQHKVVKSLQSRNIRVLDMTDILAESDDYRNFLLRDNDNTHPNAYGHKRMAEIMMTYLQQEGLLN